MFCLCFSSIFSFHIYPDDDIYQEEYHRNIWLVLVNRIIWNIFTYIYLMMLIDQRVNIAASQTYTALSEIYFAVICIVHLVDGHLQKKKKKELAPIHRYIVFTQNAKQTTIMMMVCKGTCEVYRCVWKIPFSDTEIYVLFARHPLHCAAWMNSKSILG